MLAQPVSDFLSNSAALCDAVLRLRGLGLLVIGRQLRQSRLHRQRQQLVAQARLAFRAALLGHPSQKRPRV